MDAKDNGLKTVVGSSGVDSNATFSPEAYIPIGQALKELWQFWKDAVHKLGNAAFSALGLTKEEKETLSKIIKTTVERECTIKAIGRTKRGYLFVVTKRQGDKGNA